MTKWTTTSWVWRSIIIWTAAEEAGRLRMEGYCSIWTPANPTGRGGGNDGNHQTTLAILEVSRRLWGPCGTFETLGLDTHFWAFEGSHAGGGWYLHTFPQETVRRQPTRSKWSKFGSSHTRSARHLSLLPTSTWSLTTCSIGQKANIVVPEVVHTCTTCRGRIIDFAVISESLQPFWRAIAPELSSPCKPHIGTCLHFTAGPTHIRVKQACFPENFGFPKTVEQVVPSRKRMKSKTKPEEPIKRETKFVCKAEHCDSATLSRGQNVISRSIGSSATRTQACALGQRFQEFMQTAEECVAGAHGYAEHERGRYSGRSAGVRFRLRTVVSARRHLATRQCHNKHANCWETITARITDLIKLCQREQEGDCVSAHWFQDVSSALKREGRSNGEFSSRRWMDHGAVASDPTGLDPQQLVRPRRSGGCASQCDAARQGLCQESLGKGTRSGEGVGGGGIESRRQTCSQMDWEDRDEAAAGRGCDQWVGAFLHTS